MNVKTKPVTKFDIDEIRADFPVLDQEINGHPLVYLDSGASTHKPKQVIDATSSFYSKDYSNVHRGIHTLSQRATDRFENARRTIQHFIGAASEQEIIFTRSTTEAINLVAHSWGRVNVSAGDEILISEMEHHSNIVPWQILAEQTGARLVVTPVTDAGALDMAAFYERLSSKTRLVSITHLSNALGTLPPLEEIISAAHKAGAVVMVDAAQASARCAINVADLNCDFLAFSGHKIYGPSGIGVLYGKQSLLDAMPPYQSGGDMIEHVSFSGTTYNKLPFKFEAGTPNMVGADGLAVAIDYVSAIGLPAIIEHEINLLQYATEKAHAISGLRIIGTAKRKLGLLSFVVGGVHSTDIGTLLDQQGVAIRVGHHCTIPLMERFGLNSTARFSLGIYNSHSDIDLAFEALEGALKILN